MFGVKQTPVLKDIEVSFAYSLPYVYTDLLRDLSESKKFLLQQGGKITRKSPLDQINNSSTQNQQVPKNQLDTKSRIRQLEQ